MTRLTDERLAEILRPKELIGETELESLAREVRELRESHSVACETCDGLLDSNHELRAENVRLERELRKSVEDAGQYRKNWLSIQNEIGVHCLISAVEWVKSIKDTIEQLTRERDAAREFNRRFRNETRPSERDKLIDDYDYRFGQPQQPEPEMPRPICKRTTGIYKKYNVTRVDGTDIPGGKHHGCALFVLDITHDPHARAAAIAYANSCQRDYPALARDLRIWATDEQPQQPEPAGELVPWTAETRPRGTVWLRFRSDPTREWLINYWSPEYFSDSSGDDVESFTDALEKYEWSRDGVTWERCGVVR